VVESFVSAGLAVLRFENKPPDGAAEAPHE
jgi:hypothetical protein